ncbi:MAG: hypothetical protein ABI606_20135 [Rhodoferax sp.]
MTNPLNPLDWVKSAQDWFVRAERSSGFRPFLIFLLLCFSAGILLVVISKDRPIVEAVALFLIGFPVLGFIPLYFWKAHSDPDFCRSETHVERLKKIELEAMGTESLQIDGDLFEREIITTSIKEPVFIGNEANDGNDK